MTVIIPMALMLLFGYQIGRIRFKEKLKKEAYVKNFEFRQNEKMYLATSGYKRGFCDGMDHLVQKVTGDELTYWNGE